MPDHILLFHHPSTAALAQLVVDASGGQVALAACSWCTFKDGFPNLQVGATDVSKLNEGCKAAFLAAFDNPSTIFEQLAVIFSLAKMRAREYRVIVPYFSTGTMERVDVEGQVATAATMARLLSSTPPCPTGPATIVIYDIHALQEQFYFTDDVLIQLKSAVYLLRQRIALLQDPRVAIVFPDDGAAKRFKSRFPEFEHVICLKVRDGDSRKVTVKEGETAGRHCIIIDDLVQSGGTLVECAKAVKAAGASKVSCFVTHAVFPNQSWKQFVGNDLFDRFWITDTVPAVAAAVQGQLPFEVLSIAPLVANLLTGDKAMADPISGPPTAAAD